VFGICPSPPGPQRLWAHPRSSRVRPSLGEARPYTAGDHSVAPTVTREGDHSVAPVHKDLERRPLGGAHLPTEERRPHGGTQLWIKRRRPLGGARALLRRRPLGGASNNHKKRPLGGAINIRFVRRVRHHCLSGHLVPLGLSPPLGGGRGDHSVAPRTYTATARRHCAQRRQRFLLRAAWTPPQD
jgi:hypothetical protein